MDMVEDAFYLLKKPEVRRCCCAKNYKDNREGHRKLRHGIL